MKLLKRILVFLFGDNVDTYPYKIIELDYDDALIEFDDGNYIYELDLEWEKGVMDIEFGVKGSKNKDTTNTNNQYKVIKTVSYITRRMSDTISEHNGIIFHTVTFKSSNWRNGSVDLRSGEIRNRVFMRYLHRQFPNAELEKGESDILTIKLNCV